MSCEHLRSMLTDVALGARVPPQLESHLEACASCRDALTREHLMLERIDAEIKDLMSETPSPALLTGIRQRLEERTAARSLSSLGWLLPATAVVGLLFIGVLFLRRTPIDRSDTSIRSSVETTNVAPTPFEDPRRSNPAAAPPRPIRVASGRSARPVEPEILIPQEDRIALDRYYERLRHKRVKWNLFRAGQPPTLDVLPAVPTLDDSSQVQIVVRSMEITPLETPFIEQESES